MLYNMLFVFFFYLGLFFVENNRIFFKREDDSVDFLRLVLKFSWNRIFLIIEFIFFWKVKCFLVRLLFSVSLMKYVYFDVLDWGFYDEVEEVSIEFIVFFLVIVLSFGCGFLMYMFSSLE